MLLRELERSKRAEPWLFAEDLFHHAFIFFRFKRAGGINQLSPIRERREGVPQHPGLQFRQSSNVARGKPPFYFRVAGQSSGA